MRPILDMDNIQIEITNACVRSCSNCTRFCGHHATPYFMELDQVKLAIDSMANYPNIIGIMGGEPLLHPSFKEICAYLHSKFPRSQCGLWTSLPAGKESLAPTIVDTFGHVFLNDHTRGDIYHAPLLIGIQELVIEPRRMWIDIDKCWLQNSWSASINPYGAYFCEVAAALALLFEDPTDAWPVGQGWWWATPKDYKAQMERWCPRCGAAAPLKRRLSTEGIDDVSPHNAKALEGKSQKLAKGKCRISLGTLTSEPEPMASYKDPGYRQEIAARYDISIALNERGYWTPSMGARPKGDSIFSRYKSKYCAACAA